MHTILKHWAILNTIISDTGQIRPGGDQAAVLATASGGGGGTNSAAWDECKSGVQRILPLSVYLVILALQWCDYNHDEHSEAN
eukprot:scaffold65794_cov36-Prasinocladus_malaysianus.AAC.1